METVKIGLVSASVFTTPPFKYGGLEMGVYDLGCSLAAMGHEVTLFAPKGSSCVGGKVFETIDLNDYIGNNNWAQAELEASAKYMGELKKQDIVHDHSWFGAPYLAKLDNPEVKVCHTHHGHCDWDITSVPGYVPYLNFFAISGFMQKEHEEKGIVSRIVYNGTNLDKYPYRENKGERLLFVGRINGIKQPHIAISAAIDAEIPIDIVGSTVFDEPAYLDCVSRWCERSNGMAKLHVNVTDEEKIAFMQNAIGLIAPSNFSEPFGSMALEAMACGTPAIVTRDGGLPEVVGESPDLIGGFVCDTYEDIVNAACDTALFPARACRQRAELFSRENNAKNYFKYYVEVMNGNEW